MSKILTLLLVTLLAVAGWTLGAAASPFDRDRPAEAYQPGAETGGGLLAPVTRVIVQAQRQASLALNHAMSDLRSGASLAPLAWALTVAFLYGCFHAAGPGHGKAVVVSYFLSSEARLGRGLWLGLRIAVAHVASAVLVVVALRLVLGQALPVSLEDMREIKLASYGIVIAIGGYLLRDAWLRMRRGEAAGGGCCGHDHGLEHHHGPGHDCGHDHHHQGHDHHGAERRALWRDRVVGALLGVVPCTGAILVLLFALANGLWLVGLLMVVAIGAGMAVTMGALGLAAVLTRRRLAGWAGSSGGVWARGLDFAGPLFVMLFGAVLLATSY